MIDGMKKLMEGLPNITIRAKDLKTNRYVALRVYTSAPPGWLYYYNFWAVSERMWDAKYGQHRFGNISISGVFLEPEQVLHIISTCAGVSFLAVRSTNPKPEHLRWSLGVVTIDNRTYIDERDWVAVHAQDRFIAVWMPGALDE